MNLTLKMIIRSALVIAMAILAVMVLFYYYGKSSTTSTISENIYIYPSSSTPASTTVSGNDVILSSTYFAGLVRSWLVDPQFVIDTYSKLNRVPTSAQLASSPFTVTASQSPLSYSISLRTSPAGQDDDFKVIQAANQVLQSRLADFQLKADSRLRYVIDIDEPIIVTVDNTSQLLRLTAPLLGLFVGLFVVVVTETYRRRPKEA